MAANFSNAFAFFQEICYVDSHMTTARCSCVPRHPFLVTKASKYADQLTIAGIIDFRWKNNIITLFECTILHRIFFLKQFK